VGSVGELERLVLPPSATIGVPVDWPAVERDLATPLPTDYKHLVDTYGLGCFDDFLWLLHPAASNPYLNLERQVVIRREALRQGRLPAEELAPEDVIPWAFTDNGDVCYCNVSVSSDPAKWTVVVNESRGPAWDEFLGSTADWLVAVLSGRYRVRLFPTDFPSANPQFMPTAVGQ
jgi:hypothetical protein